MNASEQAYFLTEIIGIRVILNAKRIGKLTDFIIVDRDKIAEVTHIVLARPFGEKSLVVPWENVKSMNFKEIVIDIESIEKYESEPADKDVLSKILACGVNPIHGKIHLDICHPVSSGIGSHGN